MTSLITPAHPFIRTEVDLAFSPDLNQPPESWTWTTMGDYQDGEHTRPRLRDQTITIANGRRDESALADPSTVEILLGNGDLALTPRNPSSPYWPGIVQGTPVQVLVQAGLPHLLTTGLVGSRARTPHNAALNVTDLAFALELLSPVRVPPFGVTYELTGKYVVAGNQRSWQLFLFHDGRLFFRWSANGSTTTDKSTVLALPCPEAGPYTIGGWFDVDNGASGNTFTWYLKRGDVDDLRADLAGSQFGDPIIDSGTTSVFNSTAPLDLGDVEGNTSLTQFPYPGRINRLQIRNGNLSTGTVVADLDCTTLTPGATGTTDAAGRVWAFSGATLTDRRPRFTGRVDKVTAEWELLDEDNPLQPTIAYATVSASGILERLAQGDAIGSALARALAAPVNQDAVKAAWTFEDESGATAAAQLVSGAAPMRIRGEYTFGGDNSYPAVAQQLTIGSGETAYMSAPVPQIPQVVGVNWQFTRFFKMETPAVAPATTQLMAVDTNGRVATWRIAINDGAVAVSGLDIDGAGVVLDTITFDSRMIGDTETMVVLEVTDDGADVDWAVTIVPIDFGFTFSTSGTFTGNTGVPLAFRNNCVGPPDGIALGPLVFSVDRAIGWLAPADSAFRGEPAAQRAFRLCRELGIPIAVDGPYGFDWDEAILQGAQIMGPQRPGKLLDLLDECANVDHGTLGEQRGTLGLTFRSGVSLRNQPTRLTLERARRQLIDPFQEVDDDQRLVNDITVSRPDGSSYRMVDPAIEAGTVERYDRTVDANVVDDLRLPDQAGWRYHLGTWREPRFPEIHTDVAKTADAVEDVLAFGLGDRLEVPDPPTGCPPVDQLADGLVEELERFQWRFGIAAHPAKPWDTAIVADDTFSRPDSEGSELAAPFVAGTGTSMSVAVTLGDLWTTDATDFPLRVVIEGVELEVTNITGASSPQTFTVTQATLNDVTKTIPAGSAVRLLRGAVVAP